MRGVHLSEERETTKYCCRYTKDFQLQTSVKHLQLLREWLIHSLRTTKIARIRGYIMLGTIFKCQVVQHTISVYIKCQDLQHIISAYIKCQDIQNTINTYIKCQVVQHTICVYIKCQAVQHTISAYIKCQDIQHTISLFN